MSLVEFIESLAFLPKGWEALVGYILFAAWCLLVGCKFCFFKDAWVGRGLCGECHSCYAGNALSMRKVLLHFLNTLRLCFCLISSGSPFHNPVQTLLTKTVLSLVLTHFVLVFVICIVTEKHSCLSSSYIPTSRENKLRSQAGERCSQLSLEVRWKAEGGEDRERQLQELQ